MRLMQYRTSLIALTIQILMMIYFAVALPHNIEIPAHWNLQGDIDRYAGKTEGIYLFVGMNLATFLSLYFVPKVLAKKDERYRKAMYIFPLLCNTLISFFAAIHIFTLMLAVSPGFAYVTLVMNTLLAILFCAIGRILPRIPFVTTIEIDPRHMEKWQNLWHRISRFAGWCFVAGGILFFASGIVQQFIDPRLGIINMIVLFVLAAPVFYSIFLLISGR